MTTFNKKTLDYSRRYSITPLGMTYILEVYESIKRFIGMDSVDIHNCITEEYYAYDLSKAPKYHYEELPADLVRMLNGIIAKNESIEKFFRNKDNEHKFIIGFIKNKLQPRDYLFRGVITNRGHQRGENTDNTFKPVIVSTYKF
jgi:hypothetical protein